jgi:hypothetical protein
MNQKKKQNLYKTIEFSALCFLFLFSLLYVVLQVNSYQLYLHNVDLVYNNVKDPVKINNLVDEYEVGRYIRIDDLYIYSMNNLRMAHIYLGYFCFALGFAFAIILLRKQS